MKLMLAACSILAVASCSNDDAFFEKNGVDLSGKTVLVVNNGDAENMRSYRNDRVANLTFDEKDVIRVYDSNLQKYDKFKSALEDGNTHYFVLDGNQKVDNKPGTDKADYGFALFGADESNLIAYAGWNEELIALLKVSGNYTYEEMKGSANEAGLYKDLLPSFGVIKEPKEGTNDPFGTDLYMLTAFSGVRFDNGAGSNARRVRATSLKFVDGKTATDFYALNPRAKEYTPDYTNVAALNEGMPLAGWFEAVLSTTPSATDPTMGLRMITDEANADAVTPAAGTSIVVTVPEHAMEQNYSNIIYFPIIPTKGDAKYDLILFEYSEYATDSEGQNGKVWKYIGCYDKGTAERAKPAGVFTITSEMTCNATTLSEVNKYLADLNINENMVINFPNKVNSFKVGQTDGLLGSYEDSVLVIPSDWTSKYEVTLNFNGGTGETQGTGLITMGGDLTNQTVKHKTTGKEYPNQTLTPAVMEMQNEGGAKVKVNVYTGTGSSRPVQVNVTKNAGEITLGQNVYGIKAEAGNIVVDASENVLSNSDVTIETVAGTTTVNVSVLGGTVATLTQNADGSVNVLGGKVTTLTNNGNGNVTVKNASFTTLTNGENGGAVTIEELAGPAGTLTDNSTASLTITKTKGAAQNIDAIITKSNVINITNMFSYNKLEITGTPTDVNVTDYITNELIYNGTSEITYNSFGKSAIIENNRNNNHKATKASESKILFVSEWDGDKPAQLDIWGSKKQEHQADGKNVYDIYTAAELAMLLGKVSIENLEINLHANIDLQSKLWTGIYFTNDVTLDGHKNTISNVSVGNTKETVNDRTVAQYGFGFINEAAKTLTVKDLTLDGVTTEKLALIENEQTQISGIGGLVGRINNTGSFENVTVNGSLLGLTEDVLKFDGGNTTSCKVGGIVGMSMAGGSTTTQGAITIKNSTVDVETIKGQWALGGLIGDGRTQNGLITLTDNNVKVGAFVPTLELAGLKDGQFAVSEFYGRIGMLVGCMVDYDWTAANPSLTISQKDLTKIEDVIVANRYTTLDFGHNLRTVNDNLEKFEGYVYNDVLFVGYSGTKAHESTGTFSLTVGGKPVNDAPKTVAGLNKFVSTAPALIKRH